MIHPAIIFLLGVFVGLFISTFTLKRYFEQCLKITVDAYLEEILKK